MSDTIATDFAAYTRLFDAPRGKRWTAMLGSAGTDVRPIMTACDRCGPAGLTAAIYLARYPVPSSFDAATPGH